MMAVGGIYSWKVSEATATQDRASPIIIRVNKTLECFTEF
jgi:hypothetical protein